ncbi:MAG TPA: metalloregulator ArsR/SmtB family transcription factor [Steroidobacteraceae bacterium]|jgi:DNA-binding transcriptional ArsR family regulator|nr:metalloregulator ArsR/SmtB family transcription factor [Steroidobacteraceae bacterium]
MVESEVFRALADPTRRALFERLSQREMSVSELTSGFTISQPAVSQHLAALKGAGLVAERREGRNVFYRSDARGLDALAKWVQRYRVFWPERVDKLKRVLKDMDK